ncbi:MAG: SBBP repeat-containing protein [Ignavibacteria bacterium]
MRKLLFIFILQIVISLTISAQATQEWASRYYSGAGDDYITGMAVDTTGNVFVTGYITGSNSNIDYATVKYNSAGVQQWVQTYNGTGNYDDLPSDIVTDISGNVYITGRSTGNGSDQDYATIKYNSAGVQQWVKIYNGTSNYYDAATSIAVDGSGNVYVTGSSYDNTTNTDYATIKYNSSGIQQWITKYNGPAGSIDVALKITIDAAGNVYITGKSTGSGTGLDYATIKYNSSGVQQWAGRYSGAGNGEDVPSSISVDASGNVYVTGYTTVSGSGKDYTTIKYNSAGVQQWLKTYNGPGNGDDKAVSIAVDGTGNVAVTGSSLGSGTDYDYATIEYNSYGIQQWLQRYNGIGNQYDIPTALRIDGFGSVYLTGSTIVNFTYNDYATIKYNSAGAQQWIQKYAGTGNQYDLAGPLVLDAAGNVYVSGSSQGIGESFEFATLKYSQVIGIQQISTIIPQKYSLIQNYPNPFNPTTNIQFSIPESGFVKLTVFDMLGREIEILVSEELNPGTYEADFDGSKYASGVYFYKLVTRRFEETKKMLLVK